MFFQIFFPINFEITFRVWEWFYLVSTDYPEFLKEKYVD